jgi:hypothetical protein
MIVYDTVSEAVNGLKERDMNWTLTCPGTALSVMLINLILMTLR